MVVDRKTLIVVGDKLQSFTRKGTVITIDALKKLITEESEQASGEKYCIHLGQGVNTQQAKQLAELLENKALKTIFCLHLAKNYHQASSRFTNKRFNKNIMIASPKRLNEKTYESSLILDERAAEMSDHVTGQHIQGMVLTEAARQMVIAVTKKYYITKLLRTSMSFITHETHAKFQEYVFPLPIKILYEVIEIKRAINCNLTSRVRISFLQNERVCTEITFHFSVLCSEYVYKKEQEMANVQIDQYLHLQAQVDEEISHAS